MFQKNLDRYTVLCARFIQGHCGFGATCTFLHGSNDSRPCVLATRRARGERVEELPIGEGQLKPEEQNTVPCWHWPNCRHGEMCRFRHDSEKPQAVARQGSTIDGQPEPEAPPEINTHTSTVSLRWLKQRLHSAKVSMTTSNALLVLHHY
jgi:Zinc finger C-x8-C-x5-C-x3-H type (and similar)